MQALFQLSMLSLIFFISGCIKDEATPTQPILKAGSIQGAVTDAATGAAISGGSIQTTPTTSTIFTSTTGDFTISDIAVGTYTVRASRSGYITGSKNVSVNAGKTTTSNFELHTGLGQAPAAPTLMYPANQAPDLATPPTLSWRANTPGASHTLHISADNSFSSVVYNQSGLMGTSQQVIGLSYGTNYFWRVSATNAFGTSPYSEVYSFITTSPCPDVSTITYEGKTYHTVLVGSQCWLKENLDVGTMIRGTMYPGDDGAIEKYCYDDNPGNCLIYGGLYAWDEAMEYEKTGGAKGICPQGWHIPLNQEFKTLFDAVGGSSASLKAVGQGTQGGEGTNTSGFSALLGGIRAYHDNQYFFGRGSFTNLWSSSIFANQVAISTYLDSRGIYLSLDISATADGYYVRCIKDL